MIQGLTWQVIPCLPAPFSLPERNNPPSTLPSSGSQQAAQGQQGHTHDHSLASHTCCSSNCRVLWFGVLTFLSRPSNPQSNLSILREIYMFYPFFPCVLSMWSTLLLQQGNLRLHTSPQPQCQPGSDWASQRWSGRGLGIGRQWREVGYRERQRARKKQSKAAIQSNE